jgi:hypothetical protein
VQKVEFGTNDVDLQVADFDQSSDEFMQWSLRMPAAWDGGTITAKFIWIADSSSTNSVVWGLQGTCFGDGDAVDAAWGTAQTVTDANNAQNDFNISAATSAITLAGTPAGGKEVMFRAYRDADNGSDDLAADARLVKVIIEWTATQESE